MIRALLIENDSAVQGNRHIGFVGKKEPCQGTKRMAETLGILATSDKHLMYIMALTHFAHKKGKEVNIFFTGKAVHLTQVPEFSRLVGKARLSVCETSFRAQGLKGNVPGVDFRDFATQARNAEIMENCDRFVVF